MYHNICINYYEAQLTYPKLYKVLRVVKEGIIIGAGMLILTGLLYINLWEITNIGY